VIYREVRLAMNKMARLSARISILSYAQESRAKRAVHSK
jgi:hypothetical protein